jgi:DNA recombination protein RmuC
MSNTLLFILIILNIVLLLLGGVGVFWLKSSIAQSTVYDLTEKMNRLISDLREDQSNKLSSRFAETQERIERSMHQSRQELQTGLKLTTDTLQNQFKTLESQVSGRLQAIGESVEKKLSENLKEGFLHFEKVQEHLKAAEIKLASLNQVGESISDLNQLLKMPHLRGSFGENTLETLLAEILPADHYQLQAMIQPNSTERVDALVIVSQHRLPIDSKFPREQVLPLFESGKPEELELARKALGDYIRTQAKSIANKYIKPEFGTTDMALLFLPSETLYFEVVRNSKLFEDMTKLRVYPVSPNTLAMGLKSIGMAHEYYQLAKGVEKTIEEVKKARKHFDHFGKKFDEIGNGIRKAQDAFDTAHKHLTHYESSIIRLVGETAQLDSPPEAQ